MKINDFRISVQLIFLYEQIKIKFIYLKDCSNKCSKLVLIDLLPLDLINYLCLIITDVYYDFCIQHFNSYLDETISFHDQFLCILQNIEQKILRQKRYKLLSRRINFTIYSLNLYNRKLLTHEDEKIFRWFFNVMHEIISKKNTSISLNLLRIIGIHIIIKTLLIFLFITESQCCINPIFLCDNKNFNNRFLNIDIKIWWQNFNQFLLLKFYNLYPIYMIKKNILRANYIFLPYFNYYSLNSNLITFLSYVLRFPFIYFLIKKKETSKN